MRSFYAILSPITLLLLVSLAGGRLLVWLVRRYRRGFRQTTDCYLTEHFLRAGNGGGWRRPGRG